MKATLFAPQSTAALMTLNTLSLFSPEKQGDHSFSTMIFHDFFTRKKMNFHDLSAQHIFFGINDTRFMNAYQNKNIFAVARQSVSK